MTKKATAADVGNGGKPLTVALAGNPNSGKTTLFNNLTGSRQKVGNYPGVTVERKEGQRIFKDRPITFVDLPGTYSLATYSVEEIVARDFLVNDRPDVVVDVIDAGNLERNLYLAVQLIELQVPLVLAYNMSDVVKQKGLEFDLELMSRYFGAPIIPTVGHREKGTEALLEAICEVGDGKWTQTASPVSYGREIDEAVIELAQLIERHADLPEAESPAWAALKLLEDDEAVAAQVGADEVRKATRKSRQKLRRMLGDDAEIIIADRRYGFISGVCTESVQSTVETRHNMSDRIDSVVTNRVLGLPIFVALMYLTFQLTFTLGEYPMLWLETLFGWLSEVINGFWAPGSESMLKSLITDGIIGGVGGVVVFLPNIILLFLGIALLEGTGYMARAAFIMDRLMHKIGLHGKSFIPMLTGFGCSVPAILATRTLENEKDRLATMLVVPLMSCGARLPIYALIIPAFFPSGWRAPMLWLIYIIGIVLAVVAAKLLRVTVFKGETTPFVMELPPYRMPPLKSLLLHTWERSWLYLKKAGTIILGVSIILWALTSYPRKKTYDVDYGAAQEELKENYHAQIRDLNQVLGLPAQSDILVETVSAADTAQASGPSAGVAATPAEQEARERFLTAFEAIREAGQGFAAASAELAPESAEYAVFEQKHERQLDRVEDKDPLAYAAAKRFVEEVQPSYVMEAQALENQQKAEDLAHSIAGRLGQGMAPVLRPLGFDWRIGTALIGAFAAKEVFVAQMGIVFSVGETGSENPNLRKKLHRAYSPLVGFNIMLFCLIASPCMATIAVTKRESNSWKWALLQWGGLTGIAYILCLLVYQIGRVLV